jgi:aminoglycoside/choline kinase family phosphotransferase
VNTVSVTEDDRIVGFDPPSPRRPNGPTSADGDLQKRTFSGVQVLDPAVLELLPGGRCASIIDAYRALIARGQTVAGYRFEGRWSDLGTAERYLRAAAEHAAQPAFARAFSGPPPVEVRFDPLAGDGSQRQWSRLSAAGKTMVLVSHGIRRSSAAEEVDAFVDIGRHLKKKGVPVPEIYWHDRFSGLVFVEDLGDDHLQKVIGAAGSTDRVDCCHRAVEVALQMGLSAAEGFDPAWTWQTARYDRDLILEKECRYFAKCFVAGYLHRPDPFPSLAAEFSLLADRIAEHAVEGFIHRDFQSRNIMVHKGKLRVIDFQGGRIGPVQYDIASLVVDPYVDLSAEARAALAVHAADRMCTLTGTPRDRCLAGISYCALSRNLQILGAFGFLTAQGKSWFEKAIPGALAGLRRVLAQLPKDEFPRLSALARELAG